MSGYRTCRVVAGETTMTHGPLLVLDRSVDSGWPQLLSMTKERSVHIFFPPLPKTQTHTQRDTKPHKLLWIRSWLQVLVWSLCRAHCCVRSDRATLILGREAAAGRWSLGKVGRGCVPTCGGPGFDVAGAVDHRVLGFSFFGRSKSVPVHQTQTHRTTSHQAADADRPNNNDVIMKRFGRHHSNTDQCCSNTLVIYTDCGENVDGKPNDMVPKVKGGAPQRAQRYHSVGTQGKLVKVPLPVFFMNQFFNWIHSWCQQKTEKTTREPLINTTFFSACDE